MKEYLLERLYGEYQAYKASVLGLPGAEIFSRCYESDIMTNLYDFVSEKVERLDDDTIRALLGHRNILAELYERWIKKPDSFYAEMEAHVEDEISSIAATSSAAERSAA
jgi:hypothetical protein